MKVANQIKILDRKIKQIEPHYDLDRKTTKISALSSKNVPKQKHLTGEDLRQEPSALEQARFVYPKEEDKKEGLLKRLKSIEGKNKKQLRSRK